MHGSQPTVVARRGRFARVTSDHPEVLERRIRDLELRNRALERFAATTAHELMEPLVAAEARVACIAAGLDGAADARLRDELDHLLRGTSRMRLIVETLLEEAHATDGPLRRVPVDLGELARDSVDLLDREVRAHRAKVDVGTLPLVQGDPVLLSLVFRNLLLNAIRYGPRDGGRIEFRARRLRERWRIALTSQGETIAPEERSRIFDPFRRGEGERRAKGWGLGLAISRSVVERHGGEIGVEPARGRGNRFFFTIPD